MDDMERRLQAIEERLAKLERQMHVPDSPLRTALYRKGLAMTEYRKAKEAAAGIPPETLESIEKDIAWYKARAEKLRAEAATGGAAA